MVMVVGGLPSMGLDARLDTRSPRKVYTGSAGAPDRPQFKRFGVDEPSAGLLLLRRDAVNPRKYRYDANIE
jgi:hypothetical protein